MPSFSQSSEAKLQTCRQELQDILREAIKIYDFTVLCGSRNMEMQELAFQRGYSKVKWPNSKHNTMPSVAVDIAPYPVDWNDLNRFHELAGIIKGIAHMKKINIRWGGEFKSFFDGPHFELVE